MLRTLLGSCVAVCLFDPVAQVGGMNHFALPNSSARGADLRYGLDAMHALVDALVREGALRQRLEAKVFGAAHVLDREPIARGSVPDLNARFVRAHLAEERIALVAQDLGGNDPRRLVYETWTGRAKVAHLRGVLGAAPLRRGMAP
jgi:chemotaxis protein CheD